MFAKPKTKRFAKRKPEPVLARHAQHHQHARISSTTSGCRLCPPLASLSCFYRRMIEDFIFSSLLDRRCILSRGLPYRGEHLSHLGDARDSSECRPMSDVVQHPPALCARNTGLLLRIHQQSAENISGQNTDHVLRFAVGRRSPLHSQHMTLFGLRASRKGFVGGET